MGALALVLHTNFVIVTAQHSMHNDNIYPLITEFSIAKSILELIDRLAETIRGMPQIPKPLSQAIEA